MKYTLAALSLLILAACQSPDAGQVQSDDQCGAATRQNLIGTSAADLNKAELPPAARIIHPNTAVTMDFSAQRLNVHVGKDGKIIRVTCG